MDSHVMNLLQWGRRDGDELLYLARYITDQASERALVLLRRAGRNVVTALHEHLVRAMVRTTVDMVLGRLQGRYAIVAPVGAGKSTALACVAWAIERFAPEHVGMVILQERIEAGAETIERAMIEQLGMSRSSIAHVFRRDANGNPGVEPEDARDTRIIVATHQRARMRSIVPLLEAGWGLGGDGLPRAALVDEVLYVGQGTGTTIGAARRRLGWLAAFDGDSQLNDMADWAATVSRELRESEERLRAEMPKSGKSHDAYIKLTTPYAGRAGYWTAALNGKAGRKAVQKVKMDRAEIDLAVAAVRLIESLATAPETRLVVKASTGGGILQHRRTLPTEMRNALVFDAGAEIDGLLRFDDGLEFAHEKLQQFEHARSPEKVKSWERVQLHWLKMPGGKDRITTSFSKEARPWPARVAAEFIAKMFGRREGPVLVVTHKDDGGRLRIAERLREELECTGFPWDRVKLTSWGRADASNAFQECIGGVLLGVLRLKTMDLQAMALAQTSDDNLRPLPTSAETDAIDVAQTASRIYQAIGRGRSRQNGVGGIAKSSKWLVINWERAPLEIAVSKLMPASELLSYAAPKYALEWLQGTRKERQERDEQKRQRDRGPKRETPVDRAAGRIFGHLFRASEHAAQHLRGIEIAKADLQKMTGASARTFRRAMGEIEDDLSDLGVDVQHRRVVVIDWTADF